VVFVDNDAPTLSLTSPRPGAAVSGPVLVEGVASDASGINRVELWVGNQLYATTTNASFTLELPTNNLSGQVWVRVVAVDNAGNRLPFSRAITVN
jgi:hypothetical protein